MQINTQLTGTSATATQQTTAIEPTQPTTNLASPSTGGGFAVLKGASSTNPVSTTPTATPDLGAGAAAKTIMGTVATAAKALIGALVSVLGG